MRTMYGEKREYIEDMFSVDLDLEVKWLKVNKLDISLPQEEAKKSKRHRKSESASTSPDVRHRENGVGSIMRTNELGQGKEVTENIQENIKSDNEYTTNQNMTESNPAFLKYLQFKVNLILNHECDIIVRKYFRCFYNEYSCS